jgi:hypothetical protein
MNVAQSALGLVVLETATVMTVAGDVWATTVAACATVRRVRPDAMGTWGVLNHHFVIVA